MRRQVAHSARWHAYANVRVPSSLGECLVIVDMMRMGSDMKKEDIEYHSDGYGRASVPAVNVKVHSWNIAFPIKLGRWSDDGGATWHDEMTDAGFDEEWIEQYAPDEHGERFGFACECAWEYLQDEARDIFGGNVKVYSQGRSGGWAIVEGLDDAESWDAIAVSRWARFAKVARSLADDIPRQVAEGIYHNEYLPALQELEDARTADYLPMVRGLTYADGA